MHSPMWRPIQVDRFRDTLQDAYFEQSYKWLILREKWQLLTRLNSFDKLTEFI